MNQFYTHKQRTLELPGFSTPDKILELSLVRVAFVFPDTAKCGGIYTVESVYGDKVTNFTWSLNQCIDSLLGDTALSTTMWRLYIHGRHYGFVVPDGVQPVRRSIPFTSGGFYEDNEENHATIFQNVVYWDDMDQAFYRRLK